MRICYFGTYDDDYCRNQILQRGIRLAGSEVVSCHADVWQTTDKSQVRGLGAKSRTALRFLRSRSGLARQYRAAPEHDAVIVGYLGHLDVGLARRLARGRPVILDAFLSLIETVVEDRRMLSPRHPAAAVLSALERRAYQAADLILLDTEAHIQHVAEQFRLPRERFARVFVGADDRVFAPPEFPAALTDGIRRALFYGKFIPLHGIEVILRAAALLGREPDLRITLVGTGQTYPDARALAAELRLTNVEWVDWLPYEDLPAHIAAADVCLGVFAPEGKALRVIPNKVFQALACGARVITADTPAIRELPPMGSSLITIPPGDPEALAEAIRRTCATRRLPVRERGCAEFLPERIGRELITRLASLTSRR